LLRFDAALISLARALLYRATEQRWQNPWPDTVPKQTHLRLQLSQHPKIDVACNKQANKVGWSAKSNNHGNKQTINHMKTRKKKPPLDCGE
jgi:hypothetical protein